MKTEGLRVTCTKLNGLLSENQKIKLMEDFFPPMTLNMTGENNSNQQ